MPAPQQTGLIRLGMRRLGQQLTGTGPTGGIQQITSDDGSVVVTNPTGPITDLSVPAAAGGGFDLDLSFGDGVGGTANQLPDEEGETEFWIGAATDADHIGVVGALAQKREWPTHQWLASLRIVSWIDAAELLGEEVTARLQVTLDGVDTGIGIDIAAGVTTESYATDALDVLVSPGQRIGLKFVSAGLEEGSTLRGHWRIVGGVTAQPEGPYVAETFTRRHETAEGFTIETDGDDLAVWPNEGSIGLSHDWIPNGVITPPTVVVEDGQRLIRFDGFQGARQRTIPASGEFAPPVGAQFAPFYCADIVRVKATGSGVRFARNYSTSEVSPGLSFDLDIPTSAAFKLVWQFQANAPNNIVTVPNLDGDLLGVWALLEWGYDGSNFRFFINGTEVELGANKNPAAGDAAAEQVSSWLGDDAGADAVHIDYKLQFSYSEWLDVARRAQNRAYYYATYPVLP